MNHEVFEKAQELAQIIARSPEYITMRATEDAANRDKALIALFTRYDALRAEVEKLSMEKEPDFDALGAASRDLADLRDEISAQPLYAAMAGARKSFSEMMAMVNRELSKVLNPSGSSGGCSGNCSGCSGCG